MSEKPIERMTFDELRKEVQLQRDELTRLKRSYEDAIYNIGTDNFDKKFVVEQDNMKAQIKINAGEIATKVSRTELEEELSDYSTISQTADEISTAVAKIYGKAKFTTVKPSNNGHDQHGDPFDTECLYYYDNNGGTQDEKCYYYYSDITNRWKKSDEKSVVSRFKQTADGFELKGDVKINGDLMGCGGTFSGTLSTNTFDINGRLGNQDLNWLHVFCQSVSGTPYVTFSSINTVYVYWTFGKTVFHGLLDFSGATVDGLHAVFA